MKGGAIAAIARGFVFGTAVVVTSQPGAPATAALAQYSSSQSSVPQRQDAVITRAFRDVLKREPTGSELRRYRSLMRDEDWSEADIRSDLWSRSDYRPYSSGRGSDPTG